MEKANVRTIKIPWSRNERKIFGAFKWNAYVMGMYEDIFESIINDRKWENKYGYKWQVQYGAKFSFPAETNWKSNFKLEDIEEFIYQNKQLYDIFVKGISSCDIFIADITHHNPNVMIELGIAVQQSKNILLVTSKDIDDMEFDIRGLKAFKYTSKEQLKELIERQMKIYSEIKRQTFEQGEFIPRKRYFPGIKDSIKKLTNKNAVQILGIPKLKNLRMKVDFRFLFSTDNIQDWFGISLRTSGPWRYNAELVLVRYSGKTRSLTWPEQREKENEGEDVSIEKDKWYTFEVVIDEKRLVGYIDSQLILIDDGVIFENFGNIWISCFDHHESQQNSTQKNGNFLEVEYRNVEILDLSTTTNLFEK